MRRKLLALAMAGVLTFSLTGCFKHDSDVVSKNLSTAADQFEVQRKIVFYNGITGEYMLVIEGLCALGNNDPPRELSVICKVGDNSYIKDFLGLSDNVTYFVEQVQGQYADAYHYRIIFKPETVVPNVDVS